MSFFKELKRRNVFKVAIAYIIMAWLIMQVADVILNNIEAPVWVFQTILLLLGIGFVVAVFFAWEFELTPEGLKRDSEVDRSQSIAHQTGRKLDFVIIGILVLALGYFAYDKFMLSDDRGDALVESTTDAVKTTTTSVPGAVSEPDHSIAVLPFVNMSSVPEQEYFSDGLSEELLNLLAKIPELKVASRSSAFQFKGEKTDLTEVAQKLNVAHILEGSVRKAGNQLRITAQLIKADDGYHMWSETYDRSMDNVFAIQDEISAAVVEALKVALLGEVPNSEAVDPEAYALWLKGRYLHAKWGKLNFALAIEALKSALVIEPDYTEAWASLSVSYISQTRSGYRDSDEGVKLARDAIDHALAIDPNRPAVLARLAGIQTIFDWDWAGAEATIQKAPKLDPFDIRVLSYAGSLYSALGRGEEALGFYQRILDQDPLDLVVLYNKANILHQLGRLDDAKAAYAKLLALNPGDWGSHTQVAIILLEQDKPQEAWQGDTEPAFTWLDQAYQERSGLLSEVLLERSFASLHDDPRWSDLLPRMGLPH